MCLLILNLTAACCFLHPLRGLLDLVKIFIPDKAVCATVSVHTIRICSIDSYQRFRIAQLLTISRIKSVTIILQSEEISIICLYNLTDRFFV